MLRSLVLVSIVLLSACRRAPEAPAQAHAAPPPAAVVASRHPGAERVVAIGDLHGDLESARAALRLAGAVDQDDHWVGGKLVLVQTGDQLDRGDDERAILDLFERLGTEAQAAGGAVYLLLGNHEAINLSGDYRYSTPNQLGTFAGVTVRAPGAADVPEKHRDRAAALMPGGQYAALLARRDVIALVGDSVFVHGGLLPEHVAYGIDRINSETREWVAGRTKVAPETVSGKQSPMWTRVYGGPEVTEAACQDLARSLQALGAARLVIGHTIQDHGISSACGGQVWRIDVALSRAIVVPRPDRPIEKVDRKIQVLEITKGEAHPLTAP